ncbi:phosphatase PAP2 family protein [Rufibacter latericius]|uniref:Phosphatase PAP2 family protein n=1 Tax=Rufibacter latericius TaxID=2487040 RepID=A0A3M9MD71_9BACT|nr:phosphatase PAP2 family protein [Rufibacter latericius]RNI23502.1 phosphatase PAP2 family protein [Rufibacter latericius]
MSLKHFLTTSLLWISLSAGVVAQTPVADTIATQSVLSPAQKFSTDEKPKTKHYLKRAVLPSAILIAAGIATIKDNGFYSSYDASRDARKAFPNFSTKVDDYLFFVPIVGLYGFTAFSPENKHDIRRQTGLLLTSGALTTLVIYPTKIWTGQERPNGLPRAFPSGHTAYAFTIATIVDKEFRHKSKWISIGSYTIASATGVMRVLNNEHWMADVLAGAGIGILSVNTVYFLHDRLVRNKGLNASVSPTVLPNGQLGLGMGLQF